MIESSAILNPEQYFHSSFPVSGLACINPNGTHAPGKVCPLSAFPINGLTKESTSSFPSDEEILLHAVTNKTPDNIHNKFLII